MATSLFPIPRGSISEPGFIDEWKARFHCLVTIPSYSICCISSRAAETEQKLRTLASHPPNELFPHLMYFCLCIINKNTVRIVHCVFYKSLGWCLQGLQNADFSNAKANQMQMLEFHTSRRELDCSSNPGSPGLPPTHSFFPFLLSEHHLQESAITLWR